MKEQSAWRLLGAAAILLLLSGCGGGAPEPPSSYAIEVHIRMNGQITLEEAHRTATAIENRLKHEFGKRTYINIHMEPQSQFYSSSSEEGSRNAGAYQNEQKE